MNGSAPDVPANLSTPQIFGVWYPLAATWLLMALEGPLLQAMISRLPQAKENLAAFGVGLAVVIMLESPIFMILTASAALVKDRAAYHKLRNFTVALSLLLVLLLLLLLSPWLYSALGLGLLSLTPPVALLAWQVMCFLCAAPFFVAYRRLYQGILIRARKSALVGLGTVVRLSAIICAAALSARFSPLSGAPNAAMALAFGFMAEAVFIRIAVQRALKALPERAAAEGGSGSETALGYRWISSFYLPLALNSIVGTAVHPALTFFMARAPLGLESLAVYPVINNLLFFFICAIFAMADAIVGLMDDQWRRLLVLRRFYLRLSVGILGLLAVAAFSPAADLVLKNLLGLPSDLIALARLPLRISLLITLLGAVMIWQRALLVLAHRTVAITFAGIVEIVVVALTMLVLLKASSLSGAMQAVLALTSGRVIAVLVLNRAYGKIGIQR